MFVYINVVLMQVIVVFKEKIVLALKLVLIWHSKSAEGRFIIKKINTIEQKIIIIIIIKSSNMVEPSLRGCLVNPITLPYKNFTMHYSRIKKIIND